MTDTKSDTIPPTPHIPPPRRRQVVVGTITAGLLRQLVDATWAEQEVQP